MTFFKTVCAFALVALLPMFLCAAEEDKAKSPTAEEKGASAESKDAEAPVDSGFERYRTILDRMPFGPEPANFNPDAPGGRGGAAGDGVGEIDPAAQEAMKSQEEQQILASVRISALNVTPSGKIAVGFTDSSKQPAGTYYLKVGETRDGWTVKSADAREMKVTLEREGVEATLGLGEGSGDQGKDGKKGARGQGMGVIRPPVGRLAQAGLLRPASAQTSESAPSAGGSAIANLRARRAQKEAERQEEAARQAAADEQARADREKADAERERAAVEREQQRETLLQIQEELRRQREAKEQQQAQDGDQNE